MKYKFKYKKEKSWFYCTLVAKGHGWNKESNRMDVFLHDGGVVSIPWADKVLWLGKDFDKSQKDEAEREAGQKLNFKED